MTNESQETNSAADVSRDANNRAVHLQMSGDMEGARREYARALEADPANATMPTPSHCSSSGAAGSQAKKEPSTGRHHGAAHRARHKPAARRDRRPPGRDDALDALRPLRPQCGLPQR